MDIMVDELQERIEAGDDLLMIDVREPYEHEEFNVGGKLIPLGSLPTRINELPSKKDIELVMYCRSGGRSGMAKQFLTENGYTNVRNLTGGMLEWQRRFGTT